MQRLLNKFSRKTRTYNTPVTYVQEGLAVTPSDMLKSCNMGVPISSQLLSETMFQDGEVSRLTDVPFELRRGVDIGDILAYQENSRSKLSAAHKKYSELITNISNN